jgi:acetyl esterase/lipase
MPKLRIETFHPELQKIVPFIPRFTFGPKNLRLVRLLGLVSRIPWFRKKPAGVRVENIYIPGAQARIRLRVYRPDVLRPPAPAMLWLHGGGFILGTPEQDDAYCVQFARELGMLVASVDYRCAPEYPFPHGLEDSYAALQWVSAHAAQLGIDAGRIALGGESGGGGLAAALAQYACDKKEVRPVFQLLIYPMLDDRTVARLDLAARADPPASEDPTASAAPTASAYLGWDPESNRFAWECYLGARRGAADPPPYAVPARRVDLAGLPPAWIGVGTLDMFHAEDVAYAQRLRECGVACETCVVPGAFHGFDLAGPRLTVVRDFHAAQIAALKRCL